MGHKLRYIPLSNYIFYDTYLKRLRTMKNEIVILNQFRLRTNKHAIQSQ